VAALAQAITRSLDLSPTEVSRRALQNRDYVTQRFDIHQLVVQWLDIYRGGRTC
jgi:hypothetical protein